MPRLRTPAARLSQLPNAWPAACADRAIEPPSDSSAQSAGQKRHWKAKESVTTQSSPRVFSVTSLHFNQPKSLSGICRLHNFKHFTLARYVFLSRTSQVICKWKSSSSPAHRPAGVVPEYTHCGLVDKSSSGCLGHYWPTTRHLVSSSLLRGCFLQSK